MSTAFERIMRERGDCRCLHEPFMYYYYLHRGKRVFPHFDIDPGQPQSFEDIIAMMFKMQDEGNVFAKDMAYYVVPEILSHPDLASAFKHVFLVRDPRKSLMSYYRLDPEFHCDEAGLEAQWKMFQWIAQVSGKTPPVVRAEDVQLDSQGIIGALWEQLELPYVESAFSWQAGSVPDDWQQVETWHQRTLKHGGISHDARSDDEIQAEFDTLCTEAPALADYFNHHWPYYLELSANAIQSP